MTASDRELDLVLFGATGFVGRLTAAHLARHAPADLRIGLAGRSTERLSALQAELGDAAADWPLITVDVTDADAVTALAGRTSVLVSTVGPYLNRGLPVVQACAEVGTHYADLTGETIFVRRSIDAAHVRAVATGARIVHSCGFDSVPSDLGVGLAAARAAADGAGRLTEAVLHVRSMRGGISGGTIDSLRQQVLEIRSDPELRSLVGSRLALTGRPPTRGGSGGGAVSRDPRSGRWHAPFVMGAYNGQIVQRSNELTDWSYGQDFGYQEVIDTGRGPVGAAAATGLLAGTGALMAGMTFGPTRRVLDRLLPDPGEGPSDASRAAGRFRVEVDATTTSGARYRTVVAAPYDPGYEGTAVMIGEAGLELATDGGDHDGGVLTPMVALGDRLAGRLRDRGFTVEVGPTADGA